MTEQLQRCPNEGETVGVFTDQPGSSSGSSSSTEWGEGGGEIQSTTHDKLVETQKKKSNNENYSRDDGRKIKENNKSELS